MFDQQLTFDGGAEDLAPPTRQDKLFVAPPTMRGQLPMPELVRHAVSIRQDRLAGRGGNAYCSCGWQGSWRPTCVDAAEDAEQHRDATS
jgi:hypothetical protein